MITRNKIKIAPTILLSIFLYACGTTSQYNVGDGHKYQYTYKLSYPIETKDLIYQDDSIIVQFKFDEAAIRFQLQNTSESYLSIDWKKAAIGINGNYYGVRHSTNLYTDSINTESFLLPPLGYIKEVVIPQQNIYYDGEKWVELDLLPTVDYKSERLKEVITNNVGSRITLLLPVNFGELSKKYEFDFEVDSVKQIAWVDYEPFPRIPAPPITKHKVAGIDNVTTAIIVVGVLGFSAYVLSIKKTPADE